MQDCPDMDAVMDYKCMKWIHGVAVAIICCCATCMVYLLYEVYHSAQNRSTAYGITENELNQTAFVFISISCVICGGAMMLIVHFLHEVLHNNMDT